MGVVPTMGTGKPSSCATNFAVVERDGVLWIWRGHVLTADASKLPRYPAAEQSLTVDTTLDYDCDWTHVMESNLASPDLTMGETAPAAATSARFNAPNVVHHQRSEGAFYEEMHVVPIAPQRTRVMLRQQFRTEGALSVALQLPGSLPLFTWLVRNWNYRVAAEKYESLMQGQVAQREGDLVARFRAWHEDALENDGQPYFIRWDNREVSRYGPQIDDADTGTYGLKKSYVQNSPKVVYAPLRP